LARDAHRLRSADQEHVRARVRSHLVARMGRMRGLPQKLGQMLSFSHDHDESTVDQYAALQQDAEPLPLDVVRPVIEAAWGCQLEDVLSSIDPAAYAASLGQVHRATMLDGRTVAIKVQYPGIRDTVLADLKMLGWLSTPLGNLRQGFDMSAYRETILEDLERELDYKLEARQQRAFSGWAASDQFLIVPDVVDDLSTKNVLVSDWQQGDHWNDVCANWNDAQKRSLANVMLQFFLTGIFQQGRMQADWHPGNYRFCTQGDKARLLLYDFGCVFEPSDVEQLGLARLIQATIDRSESPWPLFLKLGFDREFLEPLASKLPALCRVLFEPFCCEYPYDVTDWNLAERVTDILGDDRWNFRIAGPARLIFLLRSFHGLAWYLTGLATPIFWQRAFMTSVGSLSGDMADLQILPEEASKCGFDSMARYLKIRVIEDGRTKVELTQYASTIEHLDELLDEDVKGRIIEQGIDLKQIVSDVRRRGYIPASLFCLTEGAKQIDVWLE
jgi:hypothetical protein